MGKKKFSRNHYMSTYTMKCCVSAPSNISSTDLHLVVPWCPFSHQSGSLIPYFTCFFLLFWYLQSFERVLVENKLHGLSPALSEAIQSISRWELVQAALPHVLHCTATLLSNRNKLGWFFCIASSWPLTIYTHGNDIYWAPTIFPGPVHT